MNQAQRARVNILAACLRQAKQFDQARRPFLKYRFVRHSEAPALGAQAIRRR